MDINTILHPEIVEKLQTGWYFLMFGLMVAEWPFVTLASAFLASLWVFNIFWVAILGWLGDTVGDILLFCVGKYGLSLFFKKRKKAEEKQKNILDKFHILLEKNFLLSLLLIKFTPYAPMIVLPYLGSQQKISFTKFAIYTAILSMPVPFFVAIIGFKMRAIEEIFASIPEKYHLLAGIFFVITFLLILGIFWYAFQKIRPKILKKIDDYTKN